HAALGDARTVVNVGAGAGSYEPRDREVIAIEPSAVMIAQRDPELASAIQARAYPLPLEDQSVDAAMAILSVHHWDDDQARGVRDGHWDSRHGQLRGLDSYDVGMRLVVARPA